MSLQIRPLLATVAVLYAGTSLGVVAHVPIIIGLPISALAVVVAGLRWRQSGGWVIQRQIRFAANNEGVDVYEIWPHDSGTMTRGEALLARGEYAKRSPDYQFRLHRLNTAERASRRSIAASPADKVEDAKYRLLGSGDIIHADDQFISDDGVSWHAPDRWAIGARYSELYKSARRRIDSKEGESK